MITRFCLYGFLKNLRLFDAFLLLALRVPVGLAMIGVGIAGNYALSIVAPFLRFDPYLKSFKTLLWSNVAIYELSVVPLFVLMGFITAEAGLGRDAFQVANHFFRRIRGGLGLAAIGANAAFAAVTGISIASAAVFARPDAGGCPPSRRAAWGTGRSMGRSRRTTS